MDDDEDEIDAMDSIVVHKHIKVMSGHHKNQKRTESKYSNGDKSSATNYTLQRQESKKIEKYLQKEKKLYETKSKEPKILVLGTADSGKSTFLKQLKLIHGNGFTNEEYQMAKRLAINGILGAAEQLILHCDQDIQASYDILIRFISNEEGPFDYLAPGFIRLISSLWNEPQIQQKYEELEYCFPSTITHFLDNIDRIASKDSVLTAEDLLLLRVVTNGVIEITFVIDDANVHFYDVSGLKNHRHQWVPYFDDVNSIIFIINIASYDQKMIEDSTTNQMEDALKLFDDICNHSLLSKSQMVVFFNKTDLFQKKVNKIPIKNTFQDYEGKPGSNSQGLEFFKKKFKDLNRTGRPIMVQFTCCTDCNSMKIIGDSIIKNVLEKNLETLGVPL
ncbi:guanine nucleotide binding protein, alpha subunit [Globomyces pollinis-pini]|nr:guanine nucleotide binding protein, alpha subunit [Globomyces pollinis-pini]